MTATRRETTAPEAHRSLQFLVVALTLVGLTLTAWRQVAEPEISAAPGDRLWDVELSIDARATRGKTSVAIAAPLSTRYLRPVGQSINHSGWRQSFPLEERQESGRRITLVASRDGYLSVQAVFSVHESATPRLTNVDAVTSLEGEKREQYLSDHPLLQIEHSEVSELVTRLTSLSDANGSLADAIYQHVVNLRERVDADLLEVPDILAEKRANERERAYTMVALCRAARIPARLVKGFVLREWNPAALHFWLEIHQLGRWHPFDPAYGHRGYLPPNYLPFAKGTMDVVGVTGTTAYTIEYAIANADPLMDLAESTHQDWREILDLTRLSLETRVMLAALMLLPFGVLLTAVFSEIVGVRYYGVFTPALLAMSLVYVPWQSAAVVLTVVLLLSVLGRSAIPTELTRVPRLSVVLTLVALGIGASVSLMEYFDINFGGQLILLPIVILSSLADRFYTVLEEKGPHAAMYRLVWTLLLAVLCIPVVRYEALGHAMIRYPELHLVTLAAILALSLYRGKRLSQLAGFSWLNWPEKPTLKAPGTIE